MEKKHITVIESSDIVSTSLKRFFKKNNLDFYKNFDEIIGFNKYETDLFIISFESNGKYNGLDFVSHLESIDSKIPCVIYADNCSEVIASKFQKSSIVDDVILKTDNEIKNKFKKISFKHGFK